MKKFPFYGGLCLTSVRFIMLILKEIDLWFAETCQHVSVREVLSLMGSPSQRGFTNIKNHQCWCIYYHMGVISSSGRSNRLNKTD